MSFPETEVGAPFQPELYVELSNAFPQLQLNHRKHNDNIRTWNEIFFEELSERSVLLPRTMEETYSSVTMEKSDLRGQKLIYSF